jgi:hypothetical protein
MQYNPNMNFYAIATISIVQDLDRGKHREVWPTHQ